MCAREDSQTGHSTFIYFPPTSEHVQATKEVWASLSSSGVSPCVSSALTSPRAMRSAPGVFSLWLHGFGRVLYSTCMHSKCTWTCACHETCMHSQETVRTGPELG